MKKLICIFNVLMLAACAFGQSKAIHELDTKTTPANTDYFVIDDGSANWKVTQNTMSVRSAVTATYVTTSPLTNTAASAVTATYVTQSPLTNTISSTNVTFDLWVDAIAPLTAGRVPNANAPTMDSIYGQVQAFRFDKSASNALFLTVQLPHGIKRVANNVKPHIHWTAKTPATNVVWGLEYLQANIVGGIFTNSYGTLYATSTCTAPFAHTVSSFGFLNVTGGTNTDSQLIVCKLFRINDGVAVDVFGLSFDPHVLIGGPGSVDEIPYP